MRRPFALLLPLLVAAGDGAPRPVTLAQALAAASSTPAWKAATTRRGAAERGLDAAGAWPLFSLGIATTTHTAHAILTGGIPLPIFGTIGADRDVARAELAGARADADLYVLEARLAVTTAWVELARGEAKVTVADEIAANEAQLADIARKREAAGDASRAEVLAAETQALRARADAAAAHDAVGVASAELAALLGWDAEAPLHAEGGLALAPARAPADPSLHPDARAAAARTAVEAAHRAQAHAARFPEVALEVEGDLDDPTLPGSDFRAGLTFGVPLLGKRGAAEDAAELRRRAAELEEASVLSVVRGKLVAATRRARAAAARAHTLGDEVVPAQRQAADMTRLSYREGQARLFDVLAADRALADSQVEAIDAAAEAALAAAELERATP